MSRPNAFSSVSSAPLALGYLRVSTEEQAVSAAGMEAQRAQLEREAQARGYELELVRDAGFSAKTLERPGLVASLGRLADRSDPAQILMVSKLDRLSRSLLDFALLMQRSRREGWQVVALDLGVDTSTPAGEMMAGVMATFAQYERRLIAQRTAQALAIRQAQGVRVGRPSSVAPEVRARIARRRAEGLSLPRIAAELEADGVPTARGGRRWYPATVRNVLRSLEYDGRLASARARPEAAAG